MIAFPDEEAGVQHLAFLSCREAKHPSLIEIKRFCAENLPLYMIPDQFSWLESLPEDFDRQDRLSAAQRDALMDFSFTERTEGCLRDSIVKFAQGRAQSTMCVERDRDADVLA